MRLPGRGKSGIERLSPFLRFRSIVYLVLRLGDEILLSPQRAFKRCPHKLAPPLHTSPTEQTLHHVLDITFRESDIVANLSVGEASHDAPQDSPLAVFQRTAGLMIVKSRVSID